MRGGHGGQFNGPRDEFGNLLPPSNAFGPVPQGGFRRGPSDHKMAHQYSNDTMNSQQSRGRGRGDFPEGVMAEGVRMGREGDLDLMAMGEGFPWAL
jgi:hypothetical protein